MTRTDDPYLDEMAYQGEIKKKRNRKPVYGICVQCGEPIYAESDEYDGDVYFNTYDGPVHLDCVAGYAKNHTRRA